MQEQDTDFSGETPLRREAVVPGADGDEHCSEIDGGRNVIIVWPIVLFDGREVKRNISWIFSIFHRDRNTKDLRINGV